MFCFVQPGIQVHIAPKTHTDGTIHTVKLFNRDILRGKKVKSCSGKKAPGGFEPPISCLLDRRFNQLSHGAVVTLQSQLCSFVRLQGKSKRKWAAHVQHCYHLL